MTSLVAGWPRPPRRRPASWISLSVSSRLVMLAMAGAVRPVMVASSARVIGPLTRMACKRDALIVIAGTLEIRAGESHALSLPGRPLAHRDAAATGACWTATCSSASAASASAPRGPDMVPRPGGTM